MAVSANTSVEALIDAVNVQLEAGNWSQVVDLTAALYEAALEQGDAQPLTVGQELPEVLDQDAGAPVAQRSQQFKERQVEAERTQR